MKRAAGACKSLPKLARSAVAEAGGDTGLRVPAELQKPNVLCPRCKALCGIMLEVFGADVGRPPLARSWSCDDEIKIQCIVVPSALSPSSMPLFLSGSPVLRDRKLTEWHVYPQSFRLESLQ
eukprot:7118656-Pyramimonas_sp.AAC.1